MKKTLQKQIDELAAMDVAALQTRHLEVFREGDHLRTPAVPVPGADLALPSQG